MASIFASSLCGRCKHVANIITKSHDHQHELARVHDFEQNEHVIVLARANMYAMIAVVQVKFKLCELILLFGTEQAIAHISINNYVKFSFRGIDHGALCGSKSPQD